MPKNLKKTIKYTFFLSIGIYFFHLVYRDFDIKEIKNELSNIHYIWIFLALGIGILSHISRALRWQMLIKPLGHKPRFINTFLAVLILYFVNIIIPRGGEFARCTVLGKYEKIPMTKLLGTVVIERIVDMLVLVIMIFAVIIMQFSKIDEFLLTHPKMAEKIADIKSLQNLFFALLVLLVIILSFYLLRKKIVRTKVWLKISSYVINFKEGLISINKLENRGWFIFHSLFIYAMYYLMFHLVFYSYTPTEGVLLTAGLSAFIAGGLAMLAPVQAGIGAWHFMVYETLFLFGIDKYDGKIFALISHTSTNLMILIVGVLSFILLPIINSIIQKNSGTDNKTT